jgi:holin-like protein
VVGALTILLVCQLIGEVTARALGLPIPGPVIGLMLLFLGLVVRGGVPEPLAQTSSGLLSNLSLLFVPAGVGVTLYFPLLAMEWPAIIGAVVGSTVLTIAVTALVMSWLLRRRPDAPDRDA